MTRTNDLRVTVLVHLRRLSANRNIVMGLGSIHRFASMTTRQHHGSLHHECQQGGFLSLLKKGPDPRRVWHEGVDLVCFFLFFFWFVFVLNLLNDCHQAILHIMAPWATCFEAITHKSPFLTCTLSAKTSCIWSAMTNDVSSPSNRQTTRGEMQQQCLKKKLSYSNVSQLEQMLTHANSKVASIKLP